MRGPVSIRGFDVLLVAVCLASPVGGQVAAVAGAAGSEPVRLSREQAVHEALARNPGLMASQEQIEQARAQVVVAGAFPDPTFSADVTGESLSSAQSAIEDAGLANGTVTRQPSSSQSPGNVLSQEPKAASEVRSNTKINLVVAEAPKAKKVAVPTVVGRTELAAEEALERAGLSSSVSSVVTGESADVGTVLRQSPSGGTHLPKGSSVRIFVGVSGGGSTTPTTTTPTTANTGVTLMRSDISLISPGRLDRTICGNTMRRKRRPAFRSC